MNILCEDNVTVVHLGQGQHLLEECCVQCAFHVEKMYNRQGDRAAGTWHQRETGVWLKREVCGEVELEGSILGEDVSCSLWVKVPWSFGISSVDCGCVVPRWQSFCSSQHIWVSRNVP